jgi:hypothetical protein
MTHQKSIRRERFNLVSALHGLITDIVTKEGALKSAADGQVGEHSVHGQIQETPVHDCSFR